MTTRVKRVAGAQAVQKQSVGTGSGVAAENAPDASLSTRGPRQLGIPGLDLPRPRWWVAPVVSLRALWRSVLAACDTEPYWMVRR